MGFAEFKDKSLEEIIKTFPDDAWTQTSFTKLIDAKIGIELKKELNKLAASMSGLTEKIPQSTQKLIDSNKKLSDANSRYAKALCWLTAALVFVGLLQIIISIIRK